jgi:hypothetical protein
MLPEEVGSELGLRGSPVLQPPTETIGTIGTSSLIVANGDSDYRTWDDEVGLMIVNGPTSSMRDAW